MKLEVAPIHIIIRYAWSALKVNDPESWKESNYGGVIPIVALAEEPDINDTGHPFVLYSYATQESRLPWRKYGVVSFNVKDFSYRRLVRTMNILEAQFERQDESARDLNNYSSRLGSAFHGIKFTSVNLGYSEGPDPATSEGGRKNAIMSITYECTVDYGNEIKLGVTP